MSGEKIKKHIVCVALTLGLLLSSGYVHAYTIRQGTLSIGGATTAFYSSRDYEHTDDYREYEVDADAGYFVRDNLELGLSLFYGKKYSDDWDSEAKGVSPFISYHSPLNDNSNIYFGGGLIFTDCEYSDNWGNDSDSSSAGYFVKAGWEYFFNPNVAADIGFRLSRVEWDLNGYSISDDRETRFVGPKVGLKVFFN